MQVIHSPHSPDVPDEPDEPDVPDEPFNKPGNIQISAAPVAPATLPEVYVIST